MDYRKSFLLKLYIVKIRLELPVSLISQGSERVSNREKKLAESRKEKKVKQRWDS